MFRQAAHRLFTRSTTTTTIRRLYSTEVATDASSGDAAFVEAWKKVAPNIDPPKTPIQYMSPAHLPLPLCPLNSPSISFFLTLLNSPKQSWQLVLFFIIVLLFHFLVTSCTNFVGFFLLFCTTNWLPEFINMVCRLCSYFSHSK
ncbi:putative ATP synthase, F1 complex, delta/epsilon subunit [Helianthus annuus]|nr:putative ATP synthase, F1 complex, delta/epsilon subunit [Helianthus annuus]